MNVTEPTAIHSSIRGAGVVLRLLLLSVMLTALWLGLPRAALAQSTHGCAIRGAVSNPASNPGLVWDCETLLGLKDVLRGTALLNWSADRPMSEWEGISVSTVESGQRVTGISLRDKQLDGSIPPQFGNLVHLQYLNLIDNKLSGTLPIALANLTNLQHAVLAFNRLSGSIPLPTGQFGCT